VTDVHVTCLDQGEFRVAFTGENAGGPTAREAVSLLGADAERRQLIARWGEQLSGSGFTVGTPDPERYFARMRVHRHAGALDREDSHV